MIDIKQVLHYYPKGAVTKIAPDGTKKELNCSVIGLYLQKDSPEKSRYMPHLRTLESLTPLELLRFHWAAYAYPKTIEEFVTEVADDDGYVINAATLNLSGNFPTFNAPQFLYLISPRIDLFKLIKTGQAVEI